MAKNISRKDFLKGAAMSAAGVGLFASGLMNAAAEEEKPEYKNSSNWVLASQNVKWDEEHDIVIAGYGMAGTAAYIEAVEIDPNDVRVDVYRASGPGGQCVNTTDSAVRLTHIPTGIVVTCQNEKSQLQNKEAAFRVLRGRLYELEEKKREAELAELRGEKMDNSFGSQIRNYVLYPYRLIKDTRSNIESGNVEAALDGDIDEFVVGYHRWKASL